MKRILSVLLMLCLMTGCSHASSFSADEAITAAQRTQPFLVSFPHSPGWIRVQINAGGPPPGRKIPGIVETDVKYISKDSYIVTFGEWWHTRDFDGDNTTKSTSETFWSYKVTSAGVVQAGSGGDFAPQYAR